MNKISEAKRDMSGTWLKSNRVYLITVRFSPSALPTGQFFSHHSLWPQKPPSLPILPYMINHHKQFPLITLLPDRSCHLSICQVWKKYDCCIVPNGKNGILLKFVTFLFTSWRHRGSGYLNSVSSVGFWEQMQPGIFTLCSQFCRNFTVVALFTRLTIASIKFWEFTIYADALMKEFSGKQDLSQQQCWKE